MSNRWAAVADVDLSAEPVPFGPLGDALPAAFTSAVDYTDPPLQMTLRCTFGGQRVAVESVQIERTDGESLTPRDLVALELGAVVQIAAATVADPMRGAQVEPRPDRRPTEDELVLVAGVYWFSHATWGNPRQRVMDTWDLTRTTANRWLRKARALGLMPTESEVP